MIGLNTSGLTRGSGVTVPASTVSRVTEELLSRGHVRRGFLGVGLHPVQLPDGSSGLVVLSLEPGGPALQAGIFVGDVVLTLDGDPAVDTDAVQTHLGGDQIGKTVVAEILRGGSRVRIAIVPGERPCKRAVDMHWLRRTNRKTAPLHCAGAERPWRRVGRCLGCERLRCDERPRGAREARGDHRRLGAAQDCPHYQARSRAGPGGAQVPSAGLESAELGDSNSLRVGQIVLAIGHPFGITGAVALGTIHAAGERSKWIQADVRLAPWELRRHTGRRGGARHRNQYHDFPGHRSRCTFE